MKPITYRAFVVRLADDGHVTRRVEEKQVADLPAGDVLVRVRYSSLNYKDALSANGNRAVTRRYPHTPGIDAAGIVEESTVAEFVAGDAVMICGYDLGMNTPGGYGQYIRVPAEWVMPLPPGLTLKESMVLGTAGFTAGLSIHRMMATVKPEHGEILVTGATGGVGCFAVGILAKLGYAVVAVSGKADADTLLRPLGVKEIIGREAFTSKSGRALLPPRWAGVIDTVGGDILVTAIKSTYPQGVVTCCGNAASPELPLNVYPFILRGVTLIGIACQYCSILTRNAILARLGHEWRLDCMNEIYDEVSLTELDTRIEQMLDGRLKGRTIVNLGE